MLHRAAVGAATAVDSRCGDHSRGRCRTVGARQPIRGGADRLPGIVRAATRHRNAYVVNRLRPPVLERSHDDRLAWARDFRDVVLGKAR